LSTSTTRAHFTPCVKISWRLARDYWGFGFATEAARAARDYGFSQMGLEQIVSFTVPANQRSRNVMGRIGMTHSPMMTLNIPFCQTVFLFATTSFTGSLGALGE
jgi:RimJ/RimL family protein N-acetyltransferase